MEHPHSTRKQKAVVVGGGVAALEATLALQALAPELAEVELVAPEDTFVYRPLLAAEPSDPGQLRTFPLARLAGLAGASFRQAAVTRVDSDRHAVETSAGETLAYDLLLLAPGAVAVEAVPGAVCFRGPRDAEQVRRLLEGAAAGTVPSLTFAVPAGAGWTLPLYELALLARARLVDAGAVDVPVTLVTPEDAPLALFGHRASDAVRELLEARGIELHLSAAPLGVVDGRLTLARTGALEAGGVVALPRLEGPRIDGLLSDPAGFIPTDEHGLVAGELDVWAAGDATHFPVKQGGIAAQQADIAAAAMAARAGADVTLEPFRPVLRGLLLTGMAPRFLRAEPARGLSTIDTEPLWWPPAKIVGRHLAPFLAEHLGLAKVLPDAARDAAVPVEIELTPAAHGRWSNV